MLKFKSMMRALVLAAAVSGTSLAQAEAQTTVNVGRSQPDNFMFTPIDVGMETGIFAKYGLDVVSYNFGGGGRVNEALAAGAIDFGLTAGPSLAAVAKGAPLIGVSVIQDRPATVVLVVGADGPKTVQELKGTVIGISTAGSLTDFLMQALVEREGWEPGDVELQPLGASSASAAALRAGQIDGMVVNFPTAYAFEKQDAGHILFRFGEMLPDFHNHIVMANSSFVTGNPDATRAFLAAWFETVQYMKEHRDETLEITGRVMGSSPEDTASIYDELIDTFRLEGSPTEAALEVIKEQLVSIGDIPTDTDMMSLMTTEYLPAAGQ